MESNGLKARYVIGLDIGDGESALAWMKTDPSDTDPATLYVPQGAKSESILTALARGREPNQYLFGEAALLAESASRFTISFKNPPAPGKLTTPDVVLFATALLDEFFAVHPEVREDCIVLAGHPAGWPKEAVRQYHDHLGRLPIQVELLAESQSALIHVRGPDASHGGPDDRVVVIDIGSSTTDVTIVEGMVPRNLPVGIDLGCRQIDAELAEMARADLAAYEDFTAALKRDGGGALLLLLCREAKEAQFSTRTMEPLKSGWAVKKRMEPVLDRGFDWAKEQRIPDIVTRPGGWADEFKDLVARTKEQLTEPPSLVILTGGGSRMPFTKEICQQAFPHPTQVKPDDMDPSLSVARGLASAGRKRVLVNRFRSEMAELITSPKTQEFIRAQYRAAFDATVASVVRAINEAIVKDWLDIAEQPPDKAQIEEKFRSAMIGYLTPLCRSTYSKYGIPAYSFDVSYRMPALLATGSITRIISSRLVRAVMRAAGVAGQGWAKRIIDQVEEEIRNKPNPNKPNRNARMRHAANKKAAIFVVAGLILLSLPTGAKRYVIWKMKSARLPDDVLDQQVEEILNAISKVIGHQAAEAERFVR